MNALEPKVREFCASSLDPLVGRRALRLRARPRRPDADAGDRHAARHPRGGPGDDPRPAPTPHLRTEPGRADAVLAGRSSRPGETFAEYIDWRADHPSDDLMTELLNAEFEDETGTTRRLTRDEILTYVNVVAGAGNETTTRLIGWAGKVLAEHPDQRRELVEDRSLIPNAIEELLRYEPPAPARGPRTWPSDVECYGQTVPEGSVMLLLVGSANRDDRRFPEADRFDIHRDDRPTTSPSATASTSASAPRWPGSRDGSRSTRSSRASPSGSRPRPRPALAHLDGAGLGDPAGGRALGRRPGRRSSRPTGGGRRGWRRPAGR